MYLRGNEADFDRSLDKGKASQKFFTYSYSVGDTINGQANLEVVIVEAYHLRSDVGISLTKAIKS